MFYRAPRPMQAHVSTPPSSPSERRIASRRTSGGARLRFLLLLLAFPLLSVLPSPPGRR